MKKDKTRPKKYDPKDRSLQAHVFVKRQEITNGLKRAAKKGIHVKPPKWI